ncbi:MAG: co-chaperone GroES, partial [Candidatus Omnitrophica bacterium]|nr:co-chaperone GroES [Candidatus Omnitrophota bacterium]
MSKIIEPVGDKVLIELEKGHGKTHSGLYLPQGI